MAGQTLKRKAYFIESDYVVKGGHTYVRLLLKGKRMTRLLLRYDPYFYSDAPEEELEGIKERLRARDRDGLMIEPLKIEMTERELKGEKRRLMKITCKEPGHVPLLSKQLPFKCYEHGITFSKRFIMDFAVAPFSILHYEREKGGRTIKKIVKIEESEENPLKKMLAFDIETYNPEGAPREREDPVIMVSYAAEPEKGAVLCAKELKKKFAKKCEDEGDVLERFSKEIAEYDPDLLVGYNSAQFDIPYMAARAQYLRADFRLGKGRTDLKKIKRGMINGVKVNGRVHVDLYPLSRFFGFIGLIKTNDYTMKSVFHAITKTRTKEVDKMNLWRMWDNGGEELSELAEYSHADATATYKIAEFFMPIEMELSRVTRVPLFDVTLSTSGQLVEGLLMYESVRRGEIIPSKAPDAVINERMLGPIQGALVKLPAPGVYENIAVLDFRGLYPSIIVSYNIDPSTLVNDRGGGREGREDGERGGFGGNDTHESPTGAKFTKSRVGIIPHTLNWLIDARGAIKRKLKSLKKGTPEYLRMWARSHALKILSNSFYGYLGYARSRWYSRECAESVTAWGRKHILETEAMAEKAGFEVMYMDTDSLFLLMKKKSKEDVLAFLKDVNSRLPEKMELELEDFYTRGVFVSKKSEEKGAKKKYALLSEDGNIKIRGFELVRRDWSKVAKDTQYAVLEAILRDGSKEKAAKIVKDTIERIRGGKMDLAEFVIYTQLNKSPSDYEVKSPELGAAMKGIRRGMPIKEGSIIGYVIAKGGGKNVSDKAELVEFAKDYDPDYYINNQVLPAVLKILKELGYDEDDLKKAGKQGKLDSFF